MPEIRIAQTQPQSKPSRDPRPGAGGESRHHNPRPSAFFCSLAATPPFADRAFQVLMVLCALSIFGIVAAHCLRAGAALAAHLASIRAVLSSTRPTLTRRLACHLTGTRSTAISVHCRSSTARWSRRCCRLLLAVPLCRRRRHLPHRNVPRVSARSSGLSYGTAGRHSQHHLRSCGRCSSWCRCCASMSIRSLIKTLGWTGLFADDNPTGLGFVRPSASFWPS